MILKSSLTARCASLALTIYSASVLPAQSPASKQVQSAAIVWIVDSVAARVRPLPTAACLSTGIARQLNGHRAPMSRSADVDTAMIRGIQKTRLPLLPGGACHLDDASPMPTLERSTGRRAVGVQIGTPQFVDDTHATVEVDFRMDGRWGAGYQCTASLRDDAWRIDACTRIWIS